MNSRESHLCHLHLESLKIARIVCIFAKIPSHSIKLENINDGCAILGIPWHGVSQHNKKLGFITHCDFFSHLADAAAEAIWLIMC